MASSTQQLFAGDPVGRHRLPLVEHSRSMCKLRTILPRPRAPGGCSDVGVGPTEGPDPLHGIVLEPYVVIHLVTISTSICACCVTVVVIIIVLKLCGVRRESWSWSLRMVVALFCPFVTIANLCTNANPLAFKHQICCRRVSDGFVVATAAAAPPLKC